VLEHFGGVLRYARVVCAFKAATASIVMANRLYGERNRLTNANDPISNVLVRAALEPRER
jgi:hypothetical protein